RLAAWAAATLFVTIALALLLRRPATNSAQLRYADLNPPNGTQLVLEGGGVPLAVSPDGQRIVFLGRDADGPRRLFLREFGEAESHLLPGTEEAHSPFWAPDSRTVGFFTESFPAGGRLKRIGISDASGLDICAAPEARGGSWGADDIILFGSRRGPLYRVSASGGQPVAVTRPAPGTDHVWPHFLPDGRRYLFLSRPLTGETTMALKAGSLDSA